MLMEATVTKRVLILSDCLGSSDRELGTLLMKNFLYALARNEQMPVAVMMMNDGVRLACDGSDALDSLRLLHERGVAIKACGTCLDYLGLTDSLAVGEIGAMVGSVEALMGDDSVVTLA